MLRYDIPLVVKLLVSGISAHPSWLDKVGWLGYLLGLGG